MTDQPNKPNGEHDESGEHRDPDDRQAMQNQSTVSPDAYPKDDGGRPDYGSPKRKDD